MKKKALIIISLILALVFLYIVIQVFVPIRLAQPKEVRIPRGVSFSQAAEILKDEGLIKDKAVFILLGRISGLDRHLKAGYYMFGGNISTWQVFNTLQRGLIEQNTVRIIEGDSFFEIRDKLSASNVMSPEDFDRLFRDRKFLSSLGIDAPSLEGYLYPDTYIFPKGLEPEEVFKDMVRRLREVITPDMIKRARELGLDENGLLTLASIIEKEAFLESEREIISAVYHNRLKRGMPLQADPTCLYGIKPMKMGVKRCDLKNKTPYNTYLIKGLPPGPIASCGIRSIKAALYPASVPYIYFVSLGDGSHIFSVSLSEHKNAVQYAIKRRSELFNGIQKD